MIIAILIAAALNMAALCAEALAGGVIAVGKYFIGFLVGGLAMIVLDAVGMISGRSPLAMLSACVAVGLVGGLLGAYVESRP